MTDKTPEQIATELVERFNGMTFSGDLGTEWLVAEIANAMRKYAAGEALYALCDKENIDER